MCFEGITAVWAKDDGTSAGLSRHRVGTSKDAKHFADRGAVILYVFDHFVTEDQVKHRGRKRKKFASGVENVRRIYPRFGGALKVIFQSNDGSAKRGDVLHVHTHATTVFQNISFHAFSGSMDDHFKTALLSCPPNVRWFPAQGGFIKVACRHGDYYTCILFFPMLKSCL